MTDGRCVKCGGTDPFSPDHQTSFRYEKREVDGRLVMTPILVGHFFLPFVDDEDEDE